jgi:hypothetical protein
MTLNGFSNEPTLLPLGFRIRRAQATVTGFQPSVDEQATTVLQELDGLLKKRIFPDAPDDVRDILDLDLTPRRVDKAPLASGPTARWPTSCATRKRAPTGASSARSSTPTQTSQPCATDSMRRSTTAGPSSTST